MCFSPNDFVFIFLVGLLTALYVRHTKNSKAAQIYGHLRLIIQELLYYKFTSVWNWDRSKESTVQFLLNELV